MKNITKYLQKSLYFLYLLLFFITPFLFYPFTHYFPIPWIVFNVDPQTYELFEFNKMFFVYGITILVATVWILKCIEEKKIIFKKTYLDYPLSLFLLSQVLSTFFTLDVHTSLWGYYSRFHGGLISSICYALLYWAFVSNLYAKKYVHHMLNAILISGTIVSWYGIAQHFGIDKDFWVQNVQARVFSSLGQPNWLAAFLVALIPLALAYVLFETRIYFKVWYAFSLICLFVCFLFTASRSGLLALVVALSVLAAGIFAQRFTRVSNYLKILSVVAVSVGIYIFVYYKYPAYAIIASLLFMVACGGVIAYSSHGQNRIALLVLGVICIGLGVFYSSPDSFRLGVSGTAPVSGAVAAKEIPQDAGGTETGAIRFIVWKGAWEIFKHYPVLGSGVESFAYSFYQYRPVALLKTSEWDFLYNKAHNEYFNILATTGLFGLIIYAFFVGSIFSEGWLSFKRYAGTPFTLPEEKIQLKVAQAKKQIEKDVETLPHLEHPSFSFFITAGIIASYVTILITNFFGFSVVNIALFFFLYCAFLSVVAERERFSLGIVRRIRALFSVMNLKPGALDWVHMIIYGVVVFSGMYLFSTLFNFWFADIRFAEARSLNRQGEIGQAHKKFAEAIELRKDEPFYFSEIGWTESEMVYSLMKDNDASSAADIVPVAAQNGEIAVRISPNNVLYWKKLADSYYNLTFFDKTRYSDPLKKTTERVRTLAPTDASTLLVLSNYYQRLDDIDEAIAIVTQVTEWKPDLAESWNRLGELYFARYSRDKHPEDLVKANEFRFKASQLDGSNEGYKQGFQ